MREDLARLQTQLSDTNHRLSHLQSFRTSVARTLHLRDLPETDLLQRLQALCSAHQEFTLLSRRYESASPVGEHPCPRYEDPPSNHCRPPRDISSPPSFHHRTAAATTLEAEVTATRHNHHSHNHHHHSTSGKSDHHHHHHHRHRSKSRGEREKRLHDECFDSDVHRHHCKEDLLACDDDYSKYC